MSATAGFESSVAATLRRRRMLKGGERVLVAVSGGPDSLACLHALRGLASRFDLALHVAHFDHRMRSDSGTDAAFVAAVARDLELPVTVGSAPEAPAPAGLSPEEAARERRLAFLEGAADAAGADKIATGHTLDDQAETVLMRILLGTGIRGLGGIPPVRGRFIRPLIDLRREDVEAYCASLGVEPRRDPTNESSAFLRNAIRNEVLPYLTGRMNRRLPEALARGAELARADDALLDRLAAEALDIEPTGSGARLSVERLLGLPLALRRRAVRLGLPAALDFAHVERVLELAEHGKSGDSLDLPQRLNARLEYGSLLLGRASSPAPTATPVALGVPGRTELAWHGAIATWIETARPRKWPDGRSVCVVDGDVLGTSLIVRTPRRGDRIAPLGLSGTKSVADLLSEAKVPRGERTSVPVVASDRGIVWIAGHRVAEQCKVTEKTKRFVWMSLEGGPA